MKNLFLLLAICLFMGGVLSGHDGHETPRSPFEKGFSEDRLGDAVRWIGQFHYVILHFPISLIFMTAVSEILFHFYRTPLFDSASLFMIMGAAITAIPTALFGFALSYGAHYEGFAANLFWLHEISGSATAILTPIAAVLRNTRGPIPLSYYFILTLLFILINLTSYFGGMLTFGGIQ